MARPSFFAGPMTRRWWDVPEPAAAADAASSASTAAAGSGEGHWAAHALSEALNAMHTPLLPFECCACAPQKGRGGDHHEMMVKDEGEQGDDSASRRPASDKRVRMELGAEGCDNASLVAGSLGQSQRSGGPRKSCLRPERMGCGEHAPAAPLSKLEERRVMRKEIAGMMDQAAALRDAMAAQERCGQLWALRRGTEEAARLDRDIRKLKAVYAKRFGENRHRFLSRPRPDEVTEDRSCLSVTGRSVRSAGSGRFSEADATQAFSSVASSSAGGSKVRSWYADDSWSERDGCEVEVTRPRGASANPLSEIPRPSSPAGTAAAECPESPTPRVSLPPPL